MEIVVQGRRVRATTGGRSVDPDRPLLVLLHGAAMDRTIWALIARALAHRGFSLLAPDLPGHGGSEGPAPTTVEDHATWVGALIETAGFATAHVAGHSMGSLAALHLAATSPELVASLTLLGTAATMPVHPDLQEAADRGDHLAVELIAAWSFGRQAQLGRHPTPGLTFADAAIRLMERTDPAVIAADLRAASGYAGAVASAAEVRCPTLLVLGEADRMTPARAADPLVDTLKDVTRVLLPDAGHMMMIERPHEVIDAMVAFLSKV